MKHHLKGFGAIAILATGEAASRMQQIEGWVRFVGVVVGVGVSCLMAYSYWLDVQMKRKRNKSKPNPRIEDLN